MKYLDLARRKSYSSRYKYNRKKRMAAVVVKGGAVLSIATNYESNHAEARALSPHKDYAGATIYVARCTGGISRPCPDCVEKIRAAGIKVMVYHNHDRNVVKEFL